MRWVLNAAEDKPVHHWADLGWSSPYMAIKNQNNLEYGSYGPEEDPNNLEYDSDAIRSLEYDSHGNKNSRVWFL